MFDELYQTVKLRFGQANSTQSMGDWICGNTTIKKLPFSFEDYEFQKAIADDMHHDMSVIKCSQVGLSEVQIRKFLGMLARYDSIAGIFSFPNEKMFTRFYNGRIKPILEADDIFNPPSATKPTRSKDQIQIRNSFGYITGCTEGDATSTSADFVFHDEVDLSPQDMLTLYQSRLQNSDMKITQAFSTPTFVGYGIDKKHKMGDQREYMCRCPACNHWQIPRFSHEFVHIDNFHFDVETFMELTPDQISLLDLAGCHVKCEKCQRRLDVSNPAFREWVAVFPTRTMFRSYQVRPFSTSRLKPAYIFGQLAKHQEEGTLRQFYNTVLGEPYTAADAQIQRQDIEACMNAGTAGVPDISADAPVFLGVDVGMICHLTLSVDTQEGLPHFILFETVPITNLENRIDELRRIYPNLVQGAVDRFPYTPQADALRDVTNLLVVPIQYRGTQPLQPVFESDTKTLSHYSANRTLILDRLHSWISHKKMVISGYGGQKETLIAHLSDMVRDEQPDAEAEWKKTTGNDHYFHSMALNLLARRVCEHIYATQVGTTANSLSMFGIDWAATGNLGQHSLKGLDRLSRFN